LTECIFAVVSVGYKIWWDSAGIWPTSWCSQHHHICRSESTICFNFRWQKSPSVGMV